MSDFSETFVGVLISVAIIIIIIAIIIYTKFWGAIRDLFFKKEDFTAEIQNVYFHANTYRRKVERAKEILGVAYLVHQNPDRDLSGLQIPAAYLPVVTNQPSNIYGLLERVFNEIMDAEDDLLDNIRLANEKLKNYNIYIQRPVIPRIVAGREGMNPINYDGTRLVEIEARLNQGLSQISLLEDNILNLLRTHGGTIPSGNAEGGERAGPGADSNHQNRQDETLDVLNDQSEKDNTLDL